MSSTKEAVRRRSNTRARLLDAGMDVFTEHSPSSVSVDQLVNAAGYTRGAFYSNFSTMEEVFYAVFEQHSERLMRELRDAITSDPRFDAIPAGPRPEFELDVVGRVLQALRPHGRSWFILHSELVLSALRDESAQARLVQFRARFNDQLAEVITATLARVGRRPEPSPEALASTVAALYMASLSDEHLHSGSLGNQETAAEILPRVVMSMSSPVAG
ncbi:MAG: TetR/AcrR family transcriptional regulator [Candidatus Nanopelagicales bacterium]